MPGHMADTLGWCVRSELWQTDQPSCENLLFTSKDYLHNQPVFLLMHQHLPSYWNESVIDYRSNVKRRRRKKTHYTNTSLFKLKNLLFVSHLFMVSENFPHSKLQSPAALLGPSDPPTMDCWLSVSAEYVRWYGFHQSSAENETVSLNTKGWFSWALKKSSFDSLAVVTVWPDCCSPHSPF